MFKPAMLHAYSRFHFRKKWYQKPNPQYDAAYFFWEGSFEFKEEIVIDRNDVQQNLLDFKKEFEEESPNLFVKKYDWLGRRI
jgi:hypothetical protein